MVLIVTGGGDGIDYDHADWADAVIELAAEGKPEDVKATALATGADLPIAKRHMGPEPKIHGPRVIGGTPGREFLFKVPVTGARPMKFEAVGIEGDLRLDADTGIISGKTPPEGSVAIRERVLAARAVQEQRLRGSPAACNAHMTSAELRRWAAAFSLEAYGLRTEGKR